jgi:hypothetical protein
MYDDRRDATVDEACLLVAATLPQRQAMASLAVAITSRDCDGLGPCIEALRRIEANGFALPTPALASKYDLFRLDALGRFPLHLRTMT